MPGMSKLSGIERGEIISGMVLGLVGSLLAGFSLWQSHAQAERQQESERADQANHVLLAYAFENDQWNLYAMKYSSLPVTQVTVRSVDGRVVRIGPLLPCQEAEILHAPGLKRAAFDIDLNLATWRLMLRDATDRTWERRGLSVPRSISDYAVAGKSDPRADKHTVIPACR